MQIAITGGAGYVGSVLCPMLAERGDVSKVKVIDTFWFWNRISDYLDNSFVVNHNKVTCVQKDIRDDLDNDLRGMDVVINLACLSNDISSDLDYRFTHDISYNGVMNVIDTCVRLNIPRFIQISSGSVYGVQEEPVDENTLERPISQYATIKAEIDHYLQWLSLNKKLNNITILRPATLYGFSTRQRLDLMLNIFADKVANDLPLVIYGGRQSRPVLHVMDLARIISDIILDTRSYNEIYNVSKEMHTVFEYAKLFRRFKSDLSIKVEDVIDQRSWRTTSEKLYRDLNIIPRIDLMFGLEDLIQIFKTRTIDRDRSQNIKVMEKIYANQFRNSS